MVFKTIEKHSLSCACYLTGMAFLFDAGLEYELPRPIMSRSMLSLVRAKLIGVARDHPLGRKTFNMPY